MIAINTSSQSIRHSLLRFAMFFKVPENAQTNAGNVVSFGMKANAIANRALQPLSYEQL
jgi:hypothetical protein